MKAIDKYFDEIETVISETKCKILREELNLFFRKHRSGFGNQITGRHIAFYFLIFKLRNVNIKDIDWDMCTELHNLEIYDELMKNKENLPSSLKEIAIHYYRVSKEKNLTNGLFLYQEFINDLYRELFNHLKHEYKNITKIKEYEKYLVSHYRNEYSKLNDYTDDNMRSVFSNYPMNKKYTNLIQVYSKKQYKNYWINTDSNFIKGIIENYLNLFAVKHVEPVVFRLVGYYFIESVNNYQHKINDFLNIDDRFLEYQIDYFKKIPNEIIKSISPTLPKVFIYELVILYRTLIDTVETEKNIGLSKEYINLLKLRKASSALIGNYIPMYFNPFESIPNHVKIAIIANEYTRNGARSRNFDVSLLDLSIVPKYIRNDILEFFWYGKGTFDQRIKYYNLLKDFYRFLKKNSSHNNITSHNLRDLINHKSLYKYRQKLELKYTNTATLKGALKSIRSILVYHHEKYGITSSMMKILNLNNLEKNNGGNPITDNDLKVIYNEFTKGSELYLLIFELFILTNLRIGEILNLERNCIEYKDSLGKANIRYLSKLSNGEYTSQLVSEKVTYIIEKSIQLTNVYATSDSHLSKYIFIEPVQRKINEKLKVIRFSYYFNKVVREVNDKLENNHYTANNLRHTYINNVYKEGTKLNYSLPKLAVITNNGYKTAKMYYRKYNEIEMYVEALSGVTLSDVDINGEIISENKKINHRNSVKSDLGQCKEGSCIFEAMECLICPHFVTFTNRIPKFEKKIDELNEVVRNTTNPIIIEEAISQKKLLSKYLHSMLAIEEKNSNENI